MDKTFSMLNTKDQLLTRKEAAMLLGRTVDTLAVWACTHRYNLPFVKIGRLVKYKLSDLTAFIERRTVRGKEDSYEN